MAFYLRRSVSLGPLRLNFSKRGVGVSVGVKGFRIGQDARGRTYMHTGRHGIYYRETLRTPSKRPPKGTARYPRQGQDLKFGFMGVVGVLLLVVGVAYATLSSSARPKQSSQRAIEVPSIASPVVRPSQTVPAARQDRAARSDIEEPPQAAEGTSVKSQKEAVDSEIRREPEDLKAAIAIYRMTFNRAGARLAQLVTTLQASTDPAGDRIACERLAGLVEDFTSDALPAPLEEVSFSLENSMARYREAVRACQLGDSEAMRLRLRMGTALWIRGTSRMKGVLAGDPEALRSGPTSIEDVFSEIPEGAPDVGPSASNSGLLNTRWRDYKGRCCKVCENGQPCGNSCISWRYTCHQPRGCAC